MYTRAAAVRLLAGAGRGPPRISSLRTLLKRALFGLLGKEPEARVVSFASGAPERVEAMVRLMRELVPGREHILVTRAASSFW